MDGILINTEAVYIEATKRGLSDSGYSLPAAGLLKITYGRPPDEILARFRSRFPGINVKIFKNRMKDHF